MAADVHSPPKCFPTAADACRALLFSAMNMGGVCFCAPTRTSDNGRRRSSAPEMFSDCGGYPIGAIVPCREHRGRMQYAPTRTSDNGRRRSFAPEMFSDMCARRPFAPVGIHFISHRVPSAGRVGAYCIRPFKWPRRGQIRRRRISVGRYCSLPGTSGAYAIRPYTDVRQWPLSSIRPRNGFQWERPTPIRPCRKPFYGRMTFVRPRRKPFYGPMTPIRL